MKTTAAVMAGRGKQLAASVPARAPWPSPIFEMLAAGLTVRDIAVLLGVRDSVIKAMLHE